MWFPFFLYQVKVILPWDVLDLWAPATEDTFEGTEDGEIVKEVVVDAVVEIPDEDGEVTMFVLEVAVTAALVNPGRTKNKWIE